MTIVFLDPNGQPHFVNEVRIIRFERGGLYLAGEGFEQYVNPGDAIRIRSVL